MLIVCIAFQSYQTKSLIKHEYYQEQAGSATNWVKTPASTAGDGGENAQCCKKLEKMIADAEEETKVREKEQQIAEKQAQIRANEEKAQYEERASQAEQLAKENQDKLTAMEKKYMECKQQIDTCPGKLTMALDAQTKLQVCCDTQRAEAEKARKDLADIKAEIDKLRWDNGQLQGANNDLKNHNNNLTGQINILNGRIRNLEDQNKACKQSLEYERSKAQTAI